MITNYSITIKDYIVNFLNKEYNLGINFNSINEITIYANRWEVTINKKTYQLPVYKG